MAPDRHPLLAQIERIVDERVAAYADRIGPRYLRPSALGITTRAAIRGAHRGDFRVVHVGKYLLVDLRSFEAHAALHEVTCVPSAGDEAANDDALANVDPTVRAAFTRAAKGGR